MALDNVLIERDITKHGKLKKIKVVSAIDKNYLEKTYTEMAKKGWLIETVKGLRDSYKPIEPCDLEFSVTFFQPVTPLDYPDYDKEDTYQEFCEDSGWTLAAKNDRYFVYYKKPNSNVLPIHTDPSEEYNSIWNALKKGELITFPILMILMIFQLWKGIITLRYENLYKPAGLFSIVYPTLFLIVVGGYMIPLISWLMKNRINANEGNALVYDSYEKVRIRNTLYNCGLTIILVVLIYNIIALFSVHFNITLIFLYLLNLILPIGLGLLIRIKIKKIKSKRSTNVIIMIAGALVVWLILIFVTFTLVSHSDYERPIEEIPSSIPILTHQDLETNLEFHPRYVQVYHTMMVPVSFEYESYHRDYQGDYFAIEVTYVQARFDWMADIIAKRAIYDELRKIEDDKMNHILDSKSADYVYSVTPDMYGLDMIYNLSRFGTRVMLAKDNVIYFIQLDKPIDSEVLDKIVPVLFGAN